MFPINTNTQNDPLDTYNENFNIQPIDQTPLNIPSTNPPPNNPSSIQGYSNSMFETQGYDLSNLQQLLNQSTFFIPDRSQDIMQENSQNDHDSLDLQDPGDKKPNLALPTSLPTSLKRIQQQITIQRSVDKLFQIGQLLSIQNGRFRPIVPLLPIVQNVQQVPIAQNVQQPTPLQLMPTQVKLKKNPVHLKDLDKDILKCVYKIWKITNEVEISTFINYSDIRIKFIPSIKSTRQLTRWYKKILVNDGVPDIDTEYAWKKVLGLFAKGHIFKDVAQNEILNVPPNHQNLKKYVEKGIELRSITCINFQRKILNLPNIPVIDNRDEKKSSNSDDDFIEEQPILHRPTPSIPTPRVNKREREEDLAPLKESKFSPISEQEDDSEFSITPESIVQENTPSQDIQNRELSPELIEKIIKLIKMRLKVENDVSKINWDWAAEKFEQSAETIYFIWEKYLVDNNKWKESDDPTLQLVNLSLEALEGKSIDWEWVAEGLKSKSYQPSPEQCYMTWFQKASEASK